MSDGGPTYPHAWAPGPVVASGGPGVEFGRSRELRRVTGADPTVGPQRHSGGSWRTDGVAPALIGSARTHGSVRHRHVGPPPHEAPPRAVRDPPGRVVRDPRG